MEAAAADMAQKHRDVVVGFESAHFGGPGWAPVERAVEAGNEPTCP